MALDAKTNSLEEFWMPFTDNRGFKSDPRLIVSSAGNYLTDHKGNQVIDGSSGLFCSPAGHCHPKIIEAVHVAMQDTTFVSPFGTGHTLSFALAEKDLEIRGPGQFFGRQQSGMPELKLASLLDVNLLEIARDEAQAMFKEDPNLEQPEHAALRDQVAHFWKNSADVS